MYKKCLLLSALILLVPACKKSQRYAPAPCPTPAVSEPTIGPEKGEYDEELGAYVVKEDENKFSAAAAAQAREEELTAASSEPTAGDLHEDSEKLGLKPIYYGFNLSKIHGPNGLRPDQLSALEHDLEVVKGLVKKGYRISIEGHACNSAGSTEYNIMLSQDRSDAVMAYFVENGVKGKIDSIGHGCTRLIVPSGNAEQQAPNRRVEIYAYPQSQSVEKA